MWGTLGTIAGTAIGGPWGGAIGGALGGAIGSRGSGGSSNQMSNLASQMMAGRGGLSQAERDKMFSGMKQNLGNERDSLMKQEMGSLQSRGLTDSSIAQQNRGKINEHYLQGLSNAKRDINLGHMDIVRQQQMQGLNAGMSLDNTNWQRQQQSSQGWGNLAGQLAPIAIDYLSG